MGNPIEPGGELWEGPWVAMGVNDVTRTDRMIRGIVGKRLTYQQSSQ